MSKGLTTNFPDCVPAALGDSSHPGHSLINGRQELKVAFPTFVSLRVTWKLGLENASILKKKILDLASARPIKEKIKQNNYKKQNNPPNPKNLVPWISHKFS